MPQIAIVADSGCDLPPALTEKYQIQQAPLVARFGEYELRDSAATRAEFWQRYDISQPPQSSGPSVGDWADVFSRALQTAAEVIAITITSKHSGTYNAAMVAAQAFGDRVHVFDSWSLSLGEGLLTLKAAEMATQGAAAQAILSALHDWRQRLRIIIFLDTVEAVQRGGRLAPLMALIKRMSVVLSIKPLLNMEEGVLGLQGAVRTLRKGIARAVTQIQEEDVWAVAVAHTRAPDAAHTLVTKVATAIHRKPSDILLAEAGPALAVHAGPGAFGLAYITAADSDSS